MDQGALADVIGNVFWDALPLMGAPPRDHQAKSLWNMIQLYYAEAKAPDRLDGLTEEMIKDKKSAPKQRGRAAQVRYLSPFAARLAERFSQENEHWRTVATVTDLLLQLTLMNNTIPYDGTEAASLSQRIALLLRGLEMEALSEGTVPGGEPNPRCTRWRS